MKKILIIGGCSQGKTAFAKNNFKEYNSDISSYECFIQWMTKNTPGDEIKKCVQSMPGDDCQNIPQHSILCDNLFIDDFHILMKKMLENNIDYKTLVMRLINKDSWLVIANEIGCGIVPIDKSDRMWREETGRMLTRIAGSADEVYRIYSGIPQRIR